MIAVDTNILVYAHRTETAKHERARSWLTHLAEGNVPWGLPVFCLGEFLRMVTHRKVFHPPTSVDMAVQTLRELLKSPSVRLLLPTAAHFEHLSDLVVRFEVTGNLVFDALIAAVCRENGVSALLTEDRDFSRFRELRIITLKEPFPR